MQRGRGVRDDFFDSGDSAAGFGGFGGHGSLIPSLFGGRDPFDDPFFTRPFGSMFGPSMFSPSMFGPTMFGPRGSFFGDSPASGFIEHGPSQANRSEGPIIKELNSDDDEVEEADEKERASMEKKDTPRKHSGSSKEPYVEHPDDEAEGRVRKHLQYRNDYNRPSQPQPRSFSFQSSTVTYGGVDGAYYTSSTTRRAGSDGVMLEESKEADTTTGQATHKMSRGLHDKGHSVTRKLNSDGKVDTTQTLHNLNEDEIAGFEEAWKGNAIRHLPGWSEGFNMHANTGATSSGLNGQSTNSGWALSSTGTKIPVGSERMGFDGRSRASTSQGRARSVTRINID